MEAEEIRDLNCYSIEWAINNFSHGCQKKCEAIVSPIFSIFMPEETKWKLVLFPRGNIHSNEICLYLYREHDCSGAKNIEVEYSLEILTDDGTYLKLNEFKHTFKKTCYRGYDRFLIRKLLFTKSKKILLQEDILTIGCRIKRLDGKPLKNQQIFARTSIYVRKRSLLWTIEEFSSLSPDQKKCLVIKSESNEELIKIDLFLTRGHCFEGKINLNICPDNKRMKYFTLQTFLIDVDGDKVDSGKYGNWCEDGNCSTFPLKFSSNELMEDESLYLPHDILSLRLEFAFTTGFYSNEIKNIDFGTISSKTTDEVRENWRKCDATEKETENLCSLITDLRLLYEDQMLCDVKLQTTTNVFAVHKSMLGARSPVFRAKFSTDMKKKIAGHVDVSDLDDETVRHLLLFIYTNKLEKLKWEVVLRLYNAADKFDIASLRDRCSLLLNENLNVENVLRILILSDLHNDKNLKTSAQEFILKNSKEIFKSDEWYILVENNSKLALETTLQNW